MYEQKYHCGDLSQFSFLVTGGAGFIGSNIVEYLLKYKAGKVRVMDNFSTGSIDNIKDFNDNQAFELLVGDLRDLPTCRKAVKEVDYVLHQAALGSVPRSIDDPITSNEVNITGFLNMLVSARDAGVKRMVYAASSSTYGDNNGLPKVEDKIGYPLSPYAVTKYVNELYAHVFSKMYGFHTIGLRYFNVFGPRQNPTGAYAAVIPLFIMAALNNKPPIIYGNGETSRDFTFVENVVQANIKASFVRQLNRHEVINIAIGERTSLNKLWKSISEIAGIDLYPLYKEGRKGDVMHSQAAINKAADLINYQPQVLVEEGLKIAIDSYKNLIS